MSQSEGAHASSVLIGRLDPYDQVKEITNYLERLDLFFKANDISAAKQAAVLLSCIGAPVYKTVKSLCDPEAVSEKTYTELCTLLKSHYGPKRLVIAERFRFYQRGPKPGETVAQYSVELQTLVGPCKFGCFLDDALRDRLVCGIHCEFIQKHLLTKDGLTFSKAIELAKTLEMANKDLQEMKARGDGTVVQAVQELKPRQPRRFNNPPSKDQRSPHPRPSGDCVISVAMTPPSKHALPQDNTVRIARRWAVFLKSAVRGPNRCEPFSQLIHGHTMSFLLDTGSDVNILPQDIFNSLNIPDKNLQPSSTRLTGFFGGKATPIGENTLICQVKGKTQTLRLLILAQGEPVIGKHACESLDLVLRVYTLFGHESVFEGGECLHGQTVNIKIDGAAIPYCVTTPRRIPIPLMPQRKEELDKMENLGIIQRITKPTDWCSPIVIAPKKNGAIRLCVDLRQLNRTTTRERFTILTVKEVLGKVSGAQIFSLLDAKHGFWQVPLAEDSQELTTFITPFGRFCFNSPIWHHVSPRNVLTNNE
ncbi:uncharacterized protein LOC110988727 [Acanthaster planci]|uniref:Uncharacterized protein LOC110988727 n=1 Tax=Acanthaster planci TaxID=133434 RepID=A0A8B7ZXD1_ACAPL|nr:uncharacterized protein LOC110988727 [Acanthaster planci]